MEFTVWIVVCYFLVFATRFNFSSSSTRSLLPLSPIFFLFFLLNIETDDNALETQCRITFCLDEFIPSYIHSHTYISVLLDQFMYMDVYIILLFSLTISVAMCLVNVGAESVHALDLFVSALT